MKNDKKNSPQNIVRALDTAEKTLAKLQAMESEGDLEQFKKLVDKTIELDKLLKERKAKLLHELIRMCRELGYDGFDLGNTRYEIRWDNRFHDRNRIWDPWHIVNEPNFPYRELVRHLTELITARVKGQKEISELIEEIKNQLASLQA